MSDPEKALKTQLANIEKKAGKTLAQLHAAIAACGKTKHGETRSWLIEKYGLGHGDANTLAHSAAGQGSGSERPVDKALSAIYVGAKSHLREVHDKVMDAISGFGAFEIAPKKAYVSLRRKKQFAMLGPKSSERVELGLNLKGEIASKRIVAQKPGGMCQYLVSLTSAKDVDKEILTALKKAFDAAG
jgi:hypothetical protein